MNSDRRVIVILGMHRAGTSLCTNVLEALGMRLGPRLLPGDQFNEDGYFEEPEIYHAHEQILATLDRSWDMLEASYPFPPEWWQSPAMNPFRGALVDIVRRRSAEGPGIWGFKDPRTAAILPLWNQVFQTCGVRPIFVLCMRHPAAVAHSLAARDRFSSLFSELLWFEKTLSACRAIQGAPHCVVHYEKWFTDPLPQTRLLCKIAGLPQEGGRAELMARIAAIVKPALRHQDGGEIHSTAASHLYSHLVHSTEVPNPGVLRQFEFAQQAGRDYISGVGPPSGSHFLREIVLREIKDRVRWMERCTAAEHALVDRDTRLREFEEDQARWMERCTAVEHALVDRDQRLRELEEDQARWIERCAAAEYAVVERDARFLHETEAARMRWAQQYTELDETVRQWKERFRLANNMLKERDRQIAEIQSSATWRWGQNALQSWPARRLLGPVIRAVARHRR